MTTLRDSDSILAAWLDEGPTELPSATRRAIVAALPTTTQARRGLFAPWRSLAMTPMARAVGALALVAIVAGASIYLLGNRSDVGPSPAPSASGAPPASPTSALPSTPAASPIGAGSSAIPHGPLTGTYTTTLFTPPTTFTIPAGWSNQHEATDSLILWRSDPLHQIDLARVDGDPLSYARNNPLYTIGATTPTTLGGLAAQEIDLTLSPDANKANGFFPLSKLADTEGGTLEIRNPGTTCRLIAVEVNGVQVVILTQKPTGETSTFDAQVAAFLTSVRFE